MMATAIQIDFYYSEWSNSKSIKDGIISPNERIINSALVLYTETSETSARRYLSCLGVIFRVIMRELDEQDRVWLVT
jgi:hypothetical protein